jgi:hypothetical protein
MDGREGLAGVRRPPAIHKRNRRLDGVGGTAPTAVESAIWLPGPRFPGTAVGSARQLADGCCRPVEPSDRGILRTRSGMAEPGASPRVVVMR